VGLNVETNSVTKGQQNPRDLSGLYYVSWEMTV